jgi:hypothetical protein
MEKYLKISRKALVKRSNFCHRNSAQLGMELHAIYTPLGFIPLSK